MPLTIEHPSLTDRLATLRDGWEPTDYSTRLLIPGRHRVAIASDVHLPYHDEKLLARFIATARDLHVDDIVWLGDFMDMDTHSTWGQDDYSTTYEREMNMAEGVLRLAAQEVPGATQFWSYGNHEGRFIHRLANQVGMERLALLVGVDDLVQTGALVLSDNPAIEYGQDWLLMHPAAYGSQPLTKPGQIADLEQRNVVAGHAHHWGKGKSPSGKFTVVESGGLFEPRYVKYVQHRPTAHRKWCKGFVILDAGEPTLVDGAEKLPPHPREGDIWIYTGSSDPTNIAA